MLEEAHKFKRLFFFLHMKKNGQGGYLKIFFNVSIYEGSYTVV